MITALPVVMLLWWRRSLPESPRYLIARGELAAAEQVVADLERKVEKATGEPLPPVPVEDAATTAAAIAPARPALDLFAALKYLWSGRMARRTAVTWLIWFVITFSYYGFFSWIPTLLIERGITVTKSFEFSIIIYLAQIPGYFSAAWLSERLDRKNTIALYLTGSALSAFWLSQTTTPASITLAGAVLSFFLNGTYAGVYSYTPEVFPTWIRASGTGMSSAFGRVGCILAPVIIGVSAASFGFAGVFGLTTAVLAVGVICTVLFGVCTAGRSLEELTEPGPAPSVLRFRTHHHRGDLPMSDTSATGLLPALEERDPHDGGRPAVHRPGLVPERRVAAPCPQQPPRPRTRSGARRPSRCPRGWLEQCIARQLPYLGPDRAAVREVFADHRTIDELGCGAVINMPSRRWRPHARACSTSWTPRAVTTTSTSVR